MNRDPVVRNHRFILKFALLAAALWSAPSSAQQRNQLGPLCTTDTTSADQQIDACKKIIALKVFTGEKLATIYFWRAVGWNKKGNYAQVIADASEAVRLAAKVPTARSRRRCRAISARPTPKCSRCSPVCAPKSSHDEEPAGAVVEFLADRRGLSGEK